MNALTPVHAQQLPPGLRTWKEQVVQRNEGGSIRERGSRADWRSAREGPDRASGGALRRRGSRVAARSRRRADERRTADALPRRTRARLEGARRHAAGVDPRSLGASDSALLGRRAPKVCSAALSSLAHEARHQSPGKGPTRQGKAELLPALPTRSRSARTAPWLGRTAVQSTRTDLLGGRRRAENRAGRASVAARVSSSRCTSKRVSSRQAHAWTR